MATSGEIDVPGGGTLEIVELAEPWVLLSLRTSVLVVAITCNFELNTDWKCFHSWKLTVPLTVRIPPIGAAGGMLLREAVAAFAINASRVLPEVGLHHQHKNRSWSDEENVRIDGSHHSCLTVSFLCLSTIKPDWFCIVHHDLESGSRRADCCGNESAAEPAAF